METLFSSIGYKDPIWIAIAFIFGLLVRLVGLPPLVGFLVAGFVLNYLGAESGNFLNEMADLGVTLLLFTIGLKLRIHELLRVEIWGLTTIHSVSITVVSTLGILLLKKMGIPLFEDLSIISALIIGFALSFSSTVFVVKALEDRGDSLASYGRLVIGILIVQDIFAVVFLGITDAKVPSIWAALLITTLVIARPLLIKLLVKIGHGELLVLYGLVLALGGAALFDAVDMKGDLGALVFGVLLSSHEKARELAKTLLSIKELFLVGFFLSIGMAGLPDMAILVAVAILLVAVAFKVGLFFLLFTRFKLRTRTATVGTLLLGNYSEFGLIVAAVAVSKSWLPPEWLVVMAVLVAFSLILSSAINAHSDDIYTRYKDRLVPFQRPERLPGDEDIDISGVRVLVCGMGRVGRGAFDHLVEQGQKHVLGLDSDEQVVAQQCSHGRFTHFANVTSPDFWAQIDINNHDIERVLLCTPNLESNLAVAKIARHSGFSGLLSAVAQYSDDEDALRAAGVDAVFNIYGEAGAGLAQNSCIIPDTTSSR